MRRSAVVGWYAVLLMAGAVSCAGEDAASIGGSPSFSPVDEIPADAHRLRVVAGDFFFDPARPSVPAGRPIALTLQNFGQVEHDWLAVTGEEERAVVDAYVYAARAETATGVFSLDPGTYTVICTIPGHREAGMVGTITTA